MKLLLIGPQGAGKGTVAALIEKHFLIPHISMGDLLRETLQTPSAIADEIRHYMQQGLLVPLGVIQKMLKARLADADTKEGFILDGFPRDEAQMEVLHEITDIDFVIVLNVPSEVSIRRLSSRIQCPSCGAIYNLESRPPKKEGICDFCGSTLMRREDDEPVAIHKRLMIYEKETQPLLKKYEGKGLICIDASQKKPEEIFLDILKHVEGSVEFQRKI